MFAEKAMKELNCFFNNQKVPCKSLLLLKQTPMHAGGTMKVQESWLGHTDGLCLAPVWTQQLIHGFECLHDQLLSVIKGSKLSNAKGDYHLQ